LGISQAKKAPRTKKPTPKSFHKISSGLKSKSQISPLKHRHNQGLIMTTDSLRADLWLWYARLYKTRSLSAKACESGLIRINTQHGPARLSKASQGLHCNDELLIMIGGRLRQIKIKALGERRGPASEATLLYEDISQE
jgi:ribosomal 50S subunit-recycling heat shock protein